jgi:hypothetical protein
VRKSRKPGESQGQGKPGESQGQTEQFPRRARQVAERLLYSGSTRHLQDYFRIFGTTDWESGGPKKRCHFPYGRLTEVRHYAFTGSELSNERWNYYYDANPFDANYTQNGWGRLAAVEFGSAPNGPNRPRYMYSYSQAERVTAQRLYVAQSSITVDVAAGYQWDTEGRMTSLTYPGQQDPVVQQYDVMGRLSAVGGVTAAYGPAGELATLSYDGRTETRSYNVLGQLTRMRVTGSGCAGVPSP